MSTFWYVVLTVLDLNEALPDERRKHAWSTIESVLDVLDEAARNTKTRRP